MLGLLFFNSSALRFAFSSLHVSAGAGWFRPGTHSNQRSGDPSWTKKLDRS